MSDSKETNVPNIYVSDLEKLTKRIRKAVQEKDVEVSFEFIIASLFPTSWKNIQAALTNQYTQGYTQGYKDGERDTRQSFWSSSEDADCYCE